MDERGAGHPRARHAESGFTLLEVLVVAVVIGIIVSISFVSMIDALDRSKQRATMGDMRTISRAIETYNVDNSRLPSGASGIAGLNSVLVPYATSVLPNNDHWGNLYVYSESNGNYTIESYGKDGVDGTNISRSQALEFELDLVIYNGIFSATPE